MPLYQLSLTSAEPDRGDEIRKSVMEHHGACWVIAESVWLISTSETADELHTSLARVVVGVQFVIRAVSTTIDQPPTTDLWVWLNRHS